MRLLYLRFLLALVLLLPLTGRAASPTFTTFVTNDFNIITNLTAPWRIQVNRFGTTNSFTNVVQIFNNTTNIFNNTTNFYDNSTIIVTNGPIIINGTNVATINPTDLLIPYRVNSNSFGDSSLKWLDANSLQGTNLLTRATLEAGGSLVTGLAASYILGAGANTVTLTNAALVYLSSLSAAATVQLTTGSKVGAHAWLVNADTNFPFTLSDGPLTDDGTKSVTVRSGTWTPATLGENLDLLYIGNGWIEVGRSAPGGPAPALGTNYWTNLAGILQPIVSPSGTNKFTIDEDTGWTGTGTNYFGDDGKFHSTAINTNGGNLNGSLTAPYLPYATGTDTLADSPVRRVDAWNVRSTNLITEHRLITEGAFITTNLSTATLSAGTNVLVLTNKAMLVLASLATNGVIVNLTSGNGSGQHVWLVNFYTNASFTLPSGVCFDDTNKVVVIRGNAWTPTETGESIELLGMPQGWVEINRSNPNGLPPSADDHLVFASGLDTVPGTLIDKTLPGVGIVLSVEGDTDDYLTIGLEPSMILWTNNAGILQPTDLTLPLYWTNVVTLGVDGSPAIVFGPGATNILSRQSNSLQWETDTAPTILLKDTANHYSSWVVTGGSAAMLTTEAAIQWGNASVNWTLTSSNLIASVPINVGAQTTPFGDEWLSGTLYVEGFYPAITTNYSRLAAHHTGTNGAVVFDSQSGGTAGAARDFLFQSNGVTVASIAANSGYAGGGTLFLSDDGTYKAAGGGGGTTINPTDGYLPYRVNGTTFGNSPWYRLNTNAVGFASTNQFFWVDNPSASQPNIAIAGFSALNLITNALVGYGNLAIGPYSLEQLTNGIQNIAIGYASLNALLDANYNVGVGVSSLGSYDGAAISTFQGNNTGIGSAALSGQSSAFSTAIGSSAGNAQTRSYVSFFGGARAGQTDGEVSKSIVIGTPRSNFSVPTNIYDSILIGTDDVDRSTNVPSILNVVSNAVVIGYNVRPTASYQTIIGNTNTTQAIVYGALSTGGNTNRWIFKGVAVTGGQTNATAEINGTNYSWIVF